MFDQRNSMGVQVLCGPLIFARAAVKNVNEEVQNCTLIHYGLSVRANLKDCRESVEKQLASFHV